MTDSSEFFEKLRQNPRPVVVDLWAPWCGPCHTMAPFLQQAAQKFDNRVDVWKVNVDQSPEIAGELRVMGIPTLVGFAGGEEIVRKTGMQQAETIEVLFNATLKQQKLAILPPTRSDRVLRSGAGLVLAAVGIAQGLVLPVVVGAVLVFSAFYDRCPVFSAIAPRVMAWLRKLQLPIG